MVHSDRIEQVKQRLAAEEKDALLVTGPANSYYFSGFHAVSDGNYPLVIIPQEGDPVLLVSDLDSDAAAYASSIELLVPEKKFADAVIDRLADDAAVLVSGDMSARFYNRLADGLDLHIEDDIVSGLRSVKSDAEIESIKDAYELTETVLSTVIKGFVAGQIDSTSEGGIAAEIEYAMRKQGSQGAAFPTIVATGASSSMPHHTASDAAVTDGPLLFDMGATMDWYCSDLSRTFHLGEPSERFIEVYNTVREAQQRAADTLQPGVAASKVDAAARTFLEDAGYGDAFKHSTGHGVGIEVHESPNLSPRSDDELAEGMVVTIEPGVYLKGEFGVRIEDGYLVTEDGAERISSMTRGLDDMTIRR